MTWTFDGAEWRAKGSYSEFRVYPDKQLPGWRGENYSTGKGQRFPTEEEAKKFCEGEDRRMRM